MSLSGMDRQSAEALMAAAGRTLAKFDRLTARYGEEPPLGAVVRWQKVFGDTKTYSYAAIHTEAGWFTTGPRSPKGIGWEPLIEWIDAGGTAFNFELIAGPFPIPQRTVVSRNPFEGTAVEDLPVRPPERMSDHGQRPPEADLDDENADGEINR